MQVNNNVKLHKPLSDGWQNKNQQPPQPPQTTVNHASSMGAHTKVQGASLHTKRPETYNFLWNPLSSKPQRRPDVKVQPPFHSQLVIPAFTGVY